MAAQTSQEASASSSTSDLSKPPQPDPVSEKAIMETTDASNPSDSKEETTIETEGMDSLTRELSRIGTSDYPSAFPLAMIVVALVLSIFLVALDMT